MADIPVDGTTRVSWVPSISNTASPTTTELNAGLLLTSVITSDGLMGFEPKTASIDNSSLASTFDTNQIGRDSFGDSGLRLKKQSGTDTAFTTLTRGASGYLVIRRYTDTTTAWASSQMVNVYPVTCGTKKELAPEANTMARYEVPMMITSSPSLFATIA